MSEEEDELPGMTEGMLTETITLERHYEVLEKVFEDGPIGVVELSESLGYQRSKVRYSLRVLEDKQLIEPTSEGAVPTDGAASKIEKYNRDIEEIRSTLVEASEEFGLEIDATASSTQAETTDVPPSRFVQNASLESIVDRFGSFDSVLEHDDVDVRRAGAERLEEIAEEDHSHITEVASLSALGGLLLETERDITRSGLSLVRNIVEDDPSTAGPLLPYLFDHISEEDVPALRHMSIDSFGEIAGAVPDEAREVIRQRIADLPDCTEEERAGVAQSINGVAATDNGVDVLAPFEDSIFELLDDSNDDVRVPAADTIRAFAEAESISIHEQVDEITELLYDDSSQVRKIALDILHHFTLTTTAVTRIRQLAEEDPDDDVRTAASDLLGQVAPPETDNETTDQSPDSGTTGTAELNERSKENAPSSSSAGSEANTTDGITEESQVPDEIPALSDSVEPGSLDLSYHQFEFDEETDLIGAGGQARVYRAEVPGEDLTVALKQPSFDTTISKAVYDRIINEAQNWSRWDDHPHIVEVLDWGTEPGPWIALEYMDGGPLQEYLEAMEVEQRLWTTYAIASAVAHANTKGLAHHDIKPNNILFRKTPDDQWDVPKVADWGLSREIIQATGSISQATPDYAAPEHFDALMPDAPVDERTDVYQLGVVCYELLTGEHPSHLKGDIISPTEVDDSLPRSVDDLISAAIAHDREERFEHSLLFRRELETILSQEYSWLLDQ